MSPAIVSDVAKSKASASKKAKELKNHYGPYYGKATTKTRKITPLMKKRDGALKGWNYLIQIHLSGKPKKPKKKK